MARSQRIRLNLYPDDGGGSWTVVGRRRRQASSPAPEYRQYKLLSHQEASDFHAIKRLEKEYPGANLRVFGSTRSCFYLRPRDEETAFLLARLAREEQFGISLEEVKVESRGVVLRYPLGFSLDPILADPRVAFARRCTFSAGHGRREPTRQVMVTFRGQLPDSLDLGAWGVFSVRRYTPEPPRCFKCQAFGHVQKYCGARELCGICSGRHPTSECVSALKSGERRAARCPNCGGGHHSWSKYCPERLRRLPPSCFGRRQDRQPPPAAPIQTTAPAPQPPTLPTRKRRRRRRKRSKAMQVPTAEPRPVPQTEPTASTSTPAAEDIAPKSTTTDAACQTEPVTVDAACQTEPLPPPPQVEDAAAQAAPKTFTAATQTAAEGEALPVTRKSRRGKGHQQTPATTDVSAAAAAQNAPATAQKSTATATQDAAAAHAAEMAYREAIRKQHPLIVIPDSAFEMVKKTQKK